MDERQPPPTRNSSRTVAKVAVAVLVVIAIAGIVLATLRGRGTPADTPVAADATQPAASAMTGAASPAAASAAAAEAAAAPNQVVFAPGSAEISEAATTKLIRIADTQRKDKRELVITARVEQGPELEKRKALARDRGSAVRSVLETNGVPLARMQIYITDEAYGIVSASEGNRVEVTPR
ncbi:MAG TPA: OmpA family protein [Caldimonas sp.]|nr:OmpA family protein [Caldimonas sp.]